MGKRGFFGSIFKELSAASTKKQREQERIRQLMDNQARAHVNQINGRIASLSSANTIAQVKRHFDSIAILVGHLKNIEAGFPGLVDPPAAQLEEWLQIKRAEIIRDVTTRAVELNIDKSIAVTRKSTKASLLDKSRMFVAEARRELDDPEFFDALVKKIEDAEIASGPAAASEGKGE